MYFRKSRPRTRCLYSADSTEPRSLFAASKRAAPLGLSALPLWVMRLPVSERMRACRLHRATLAEHAEVLMSTAGREKPHARSWSSAPHDHRFRSQFRDKVGTKFVCRRTSQHLFLALQWAKRDGPGR